MLRAISMAAIEEGHNVCNLGRLARNCLKLLGVIQCAQACLVMLRQYAYPTTPPHNYATS